MVATICIYVDCIRRNLEITYICNNLEVLFAILGQFYMMPFAYIHAYAL